MTGINRAEIIEGDQCKKVYVRRVGSMTMGVSLIAVGVASVLLLFFPELDSTLLAKLSPLILVGIGLEVIAANCTSKNQIFQYDFFSGLICFMLIVFSMGMASILAGMQYYLNYIHQ